MIEPKSVELELKRVREKLKTPEKWKLNWYIPKLQTKLTLSIQYIIKVY